MLNPKQNEVRHKVIFKYEGATITAFKTQPELAKLLDVPGVELISVNDTPKQTWSKKKRR